MRTKRPKIKRVNFTDLEKAYKTVYYMNEPVLITKYEKIVMKLIPFNESDYMKELESR